MPYAIEEFNPIWSFRKKALGEESFRHFRFQELPATLQDFRNLVHESPRSSLFWLTNDCFIRRGQSTVEFATAGCCRFTFFRVYYQIDEEQQLSVNARSNVGAITALLQMATLRDSEHLIVVNAHRHQVTMSSLWLNKLLHAAAHRFLILKWFRFGPQEAITLASVTVALTNLYLRGCRFLKSSDVLFLQKVSRRQAWLCMDLTVEATTLSSNAWREFALRSNTPFVSLSLAWLYLPDEMLNLLFCTSYIYRLNFEYCYFDNHGRTLIAAVGRGFMLSLRLWETNSPFDWKRLLEAMTNPECLLEEFELYDARLEESNTPESTLVNALTHTPLQRLNLFSAMLLWSNFSSIVDALVRNPTLCALAVVTRHKRIKSPSTILMRALEMKRRLSIVFFAKSANYQDNARQWNDFFAPQLRQNRFLVGLEDMGKENDMSTDRFHLLLVHGRHVPYRTASVLSGHLNMLVLFLQGSLTCRLMDTVTLNLQPGHRERSWVSVWSYL